MSVYVIKRTLMMVPMMIGITMISFLIIHLAPGDPTEMLTDLNPHSSAESLKKLRELYNLDKPLAFQYFLWVKDIAILDFGTSFSQDARPVIDKISERIPITLLINALSLIIIIVIAIPIGVVSATKQYSLFDKASSIFVFFGFSMPTFWLALLLMILFGVILGWFPISGITSFNHDQLTPFYKLVDYVKHLFMPVLVSALTGLAGLSRFTRQNMLEVILQDYIVTARAKGLSERRVIYKHAMKNALLPVITIMALSLPGLIGGSVIFESIYSIPGMGQLFFQSVMSRDYPVIMGVLVIGSFLTLVANLLADITYAFVDPRITYD
ncbi:MAG TPA: ABC transporter permease [Nitrospinota bacterium]|jgi:peptide/nickel transport system permease protein|nr:ABC transporter permease [Nitrospinota bacterium]|tara:strand:+ start:128213 stop:129187 length:975 start_codon:yes stop_codon:yes gene_type:complete